MRVRRAELGISQAELAEAAGVGVALIGQLEKDAGVSHGLVEVSRVAAALGVSLAWLVDGVEA